MRVTGDTVFDAILTTRLEKTSIERRKNLDEKQRDQYIDHYREDVPNLIASIAELKLSLQDLAAVADMIYTYATNLKETSSEGVYFAETMTYLYAEIINKLTKHGLTRHESANHTK